MKDRFVTVAPDTGDIGPGHYDIETRSSTSALGVCIQKSIRFPKLKANGPGAGQYCVGGFLDDLEKRPSSVKQPLGLYASRPNKITNAFPSPSTYDPNLGIGRQVATLPTFSLKVSSAFSKYQTKKPKKKIEFPSTFNEKKIARKEAYLAMYF